MTGTTGRVTASGQLVTGSGVIYGISLVGGGAITQVILYDNTAASGKVLWEGETFAAQSPQIGGLSIAFSKGIYVSITGSPTAVLVNYG